MRSELSDRFEGSIIPIDIQVNPTQGSLQPEAEKRRKTIPSVDGLLAATGLSKNTAIAARNDFELEFGGVLLRTL